MLPVAYQLPAAGLIVAGGLLACFFGSRLFKVVLGLFGFIVGALAASSVFGEGSSTAMVVAAIAGGLCGAVLLPGDIWERQHDLIFELELHRAECEFLTGALAEAEQRLAVLSARAATTIERARVTCLQVDLYTTLDQGSRAIAWLEIWTANGWAASMTARIFALAM